METRAPWLPARLPSGWKSIDQIPGVPDGMQPAFVRNGMIVLLDCARRRDGRFWTHVSVSYKDRLPSYFDMLEVKRLFLPTLTALQIFPPESEHVNIHPYCLHWFACEESILPDFTEGSGSI